MKTTITFAALAAVTAACAATTTGTSMPSEPNPTPIPREAIFGNPERTQGRISPDGAYVSWLAPKDDVMNIWVAPADDPADAKVITQDTYRGIRQHQWAPNSRFVYYLQDQGGDENFHVYAAEIATGEVTDLTPVSEGARATIEAISIQHPDKLVVGINDRNPQLFDLHLIDVTTGERELLKENPGYAGWLIDNDLKPRFGMQQTAAGGAEIVTFDGDVFLEISPEDSLSSFPLGFTADGSAFYMTDSRGFDKVAAVKVDAESGEREVIAQSDLADIAEGAWDPETNEPLAYAVNYLRKEWTAIDDSFADDLAFLKQEIDGSLSILASTDDLTKMVVYAEAARAPGIYYLYDRDNRAVTEMFGTRPDLADYSLAEMHPVEIPARDGLTLVSYLTLPVGSDSDGDGRPDEALPMVLNVHGGPWARDEYGYDSWHQWLADRGYAVLSVNYRGSTGFGKEFMNAAIGEFAGKMHDDLIDAVKWAVDEGVAIEDQVAIAGGSYGGYATLIGVSHTPDAFSCGVDIVGPSSLVTLIESFPEYWKPYLEGTWYKFVGDPADEDARADMLERSAISRVDDISVPLLIGQGENDPRVTKLESDQLVDVMAQKGLPVTYVNFPDEGHGFARPPNRFAFYSVMEGFLAECLGGRYEPINDAFEGSTVQILHGAEYVAGLEDAVAAHSSEDDEQDG